MKFNIFSNNIVQVIRLRNQVLEQPSGTFIAPAIHEKFITNIIALTQNIFEIQSIEQEIQNLPTIDTARNKSPQNTLHSDQIIMANALYEDYYVRESMAKMMELCDQFTLLNYLYLTMNSIYSLPVVMKFVEKHRHAVGYWVFKDI